METMTPLRLLLGITVFMTGLAGCDSLKPNKVRQASTAQEEFEFYPIDPQPELIGGLASLQDSVRYPTAARQDSVEGRVFVQFVVTEEGRAREVRVLRGVHPALDREAMRVVRQTRWTTQWAPAQMALPISFRLPDAE